MRKLRALSDRLVGLVVPNVTAQGIWLDQYSCREYCGAGFLRNKYHRRCHDSSGQCTPWQLVGCNC